MFERFKKAQCNKPPKKKPSNALNISVCSNLKLGFYQKTKDKIENIYYNKTQNSPPNLLKTDYGD